MKKNILFVVLLMFQICKATSVQELFLQGNQYFMNGDFVKARECYEQIPHKNADLWQNIGNCYYNESNDAKALVCWKRAQRDAGYNQLDQLFESEKLVLNKVNCPCDGVFIRGVKKVILALPKLLMQVLLMLFLLLFLVLFYECVLQKKKKYTSIACKKSYLCFLLFSIVVLMLLIAAKDKFVKEKQGVIMQHKVAVHVGPESSFHQKTVLPQGCIVEVIDEDRGMYKISCSQGFGWIASENIEIV